MDTNADGKDDEIIASIQKGRQKEDTRASVTGRPNIDVISKRNEEVARQERKSSHVVTGIIVLLVMAIMFLVYFFS